MFHLLMKTINLFVAVLLLHFSVILSSESPQGIQSICYNKLLNMQGTFPHYEFSPQKLKCLMHLKYYKC